MGSEDFFATATAAGLAISTTVAGASGVAMEAGAVTTGLKAVADTRSLSSTAAAALLDAAGEEAAAAAGLLGAVLTAVVAAAERAGAALALWAGGEDRAAGVKVANCFCCFAAGGLEGEAAAGAAALGTHSLALARRLAALVGDTGLLSLPFWVRFCSSCRHSPTREGSGFWALVLSVREQKV